jgi:hypothetical protein
MSFYNNIFASSFRFYNKFYEIPISIFRAILIVVMHQIGFLLIILTTIKKVINFDFIGYNHLVTFLLLVLLFSLVFLNKNYYNKDKIKSIIINYDRNNTFLKRTWGFITIFTLLIEYIITAILLLK